MAVGGVPDLTEISKVSENIQAQNDEITVLQSIFEGEDNRIEILQSCQFLDSREITSQNMLKMYVPVKCDRKIHVDIHLPVEDHQTNSFAPPSGLQVTRSDSGQRILFSFEVTYLPPVCLHVTLPPTYPEQDPPCYVISCVWLSPKQLTVLCRELDQLWTECKGGVDSPGEPILYTWLDWLQEQLLKTLGIEHHISVTSHTIDEEVDDCRVVIETEDLNSIVTEIFRYNQHAKKNMFNKSDQVCNICFDQNLGYKFFLLPDCGHHVCRDCLSSHCQLLVKEGSVLHIRCPMFECKAYIPPHVLKEILTREEFERFESLSLQKGLEIMGDVTWCPRCNSVVIQEPEECLNLAHCTVCFYTFCTQCMEKSHQGERCKNDVEEAELQQQDIDRRAEQAQKQQEEHRKLLQKKQNRESDAYIRQMAKRCPKCKSPIMKIGGCNKVSCSRCGASMCYLCEKDISQQGYSHFTNQCNTFTFENDVIDNTDFADPIRMGVVRMQGVRPAAEPKKPSKGSEIEDRLWTDPQLRKLLLTCFTCKQKNLKETHCNHIRCWNCKNSMCFYCRQKISGPVGKHYMGVNACMQHSWDPGLMEPAPI